MNYPVDLTKKYVQYNTATKTAEKIYIDWPRPDGMEIVGLDKNIRYLEYVEGPKPELLVNEELVVSEAAQLSQNRYVVSYSKKEKQLTPAQIFNNAINDGYLVNPEGFVLGLAEDDQNAFTRLLTLASLAGANDETVFTISDKSGKLHGVKYHM